MNYRIENRKLVWVEDGRETLSLDGNQITGIEPGVLPASLRWLSLDGNQKRSFGASVETGATII